MNEMMVIWLVVFIITVVLEAATMGLTTIWFAGGALIAFFTAMLGMPLWLQIVVFLVISLLLLFFTRPIAVKYFNKDRVVTNADSLIGAKAVVINEIDNLQGEGRVSVKGQEWSARSVDDSVKIAQDTVVKVLEIQGVKLIVKAEE